LRHNLIWYNTQRLYRILGTSLISLEWIETAWLRQQLPGTWQRVLPTHQAYQLHMAPARPVTDWIQCEEAQQSWPPENLKWCWPLVFVTSSSASPSQAAMTLWPVSSVYEHVPSLTAQAYVQYLTYSLKRTYGMRTLFYCKLKICCTKQFKIHCTTAVWLCHTSCTDW